MRKLNTSDVFAMARVIRASGIRGELQELIRRVAGSDTPAESVGIEGFLIIMEALAERKSETAIYEALAGPFEMDAGDIATMDLESLSERLTELVKENDLKRFFDFVLRILGKK